MSIDLDRFLELKKDAERRQREADKASGALAQLKEELKTRYKCKTLKEAESLVAKKREGIEAMEVEYEDKLAAFDEAHGEKLK